VQVQLLALHLLDSLLDVFRINWQHRFSLHLLLICKLVCPGSLLPI
jgi:hypothetical protein